MGQNISANQSKINIRESEDTDTPFFEKLYFETRRDEFAQIGWDENQIRMLLQMQFNVQTQAYQMQFPDARTSVIEADGTAVGRLITGDNSNELRLIDVAVLPESRGLGIGSFVMNKLQTEARKTGKPVTLQVLKTNIPAIRLYEKFGFETISEDELYLAMEWRTEPL
ncbi:hypothetical protein BH20ACI4_BH20ACI4_07380 [soil metagenome]